MQSRIAIEIAQHFGARTDELLIVGYRYSRFGLVSLILNGVEPNQVDEILDPVVGSMSLRIPGVEYIDIAAQNDVHRAILEAKAVVAVSLEFSRTVDDILRASASSSQWKVLRPEAPNEEFRLRMIRKASGSSKRARS